VLGGTVSTSDGTLLWEPDPDNVARSQLAQRVGEAVADGTGRPGIGGFLWQQYNALIYEQIILCIITIGLVGFVLDRLMSVVERRFKSV